MAEYALNRVAVAVEHRRKAVLPEAFGFWRDVGHGALGLNMTPDGIAVIGLAAVQDADLGHVREKLYSRRAISDLATGHHESKRTADYIGKGADFGGLTATRRPNRLVFCPPLPPWAERCALT